MAPVTIYMQSYLRWSPQMKQGTHSGACLSPACSPLNTAFLAHKRPFQQHGMTMNNQLHHNTLVQNRYLPTQLCGCNVLHLMITCLFRKNIYKRGSVAITERTRTPYSYSNLTITGPWLTSPIH